MGELVETRIILGGLDCADCAAKLAARIHNLEGVAEAEINFNTSKMTVKHAGPVEGILKVIQESGYQAKVEGAGRKEPLPAGFTLQDPKTILTLMAGFFVILGFVFSLPGDLEQWSVLSFAAAMATGGYHIARRGLYALAARSLDMNFLMTAAAIGAAALGEWSEGAMVVFLFSLGNTLQAYTMDKTRQSIRALMDLAPREALVKRDQQEMVLPVEELRIDDILLVKPGERIAMDGTVVSGSAAVNQAPITGESMPVDKKPGDRVFAGSINLNGALEVKVDRLAKDNTLARILHLVEKAQAQKAPSQHFVDKFSRYYTPVVIFGALAIALVPWLFLGQPFAPWFYRALILLVISCPCALVISTPVAIVAAIGNASRNGILVKGGAYLEGAGAIKVMAFDKTGTLTRGLPEVTELIPLAGLGEKELLALATGLEKRSEHPLAEAVLRKARQEGVEPLTVTSFQALTGKGVRAEIDGEIYYAGNIKLFQELGVDFSGLRGRLPGLVREGKTIMLLGTGRQLLGLIAVADRIRDNAPGALTQLRAVGIEKIAMLTGDHRGTAASIAGQLGIELVHAELLPEDKQVIIRDLVRKYRQVAMVGDGINDAPALAEANIGIAMGVAGTDVALETADVALMSDDLTKLAYFLRLSRRTLRIIKENISFSIAVKFLFVVLTFLDLSNLWMAVFADTGTALLVIANGMRLLPRKA